MKSFLSQIKNSNTSSKVESFLLINVFQIQLTISMFFGTSLNIFQSIQFIFSQNLPNLHFLNIFVLFLHLIGLMGIFMQMLFKQGILKQSEYIKRLTMKLINWYRNAFFIPIIFIVFQSINDDKESLNLSVSIINFVSGVFICYLDQICSKSLGFKIKNYHKSINSKNIDLLLTIMVIGIDTLWASKYGGIVLILKNIYNLIRLYTNFQQIAILKVRIFHNLFQIFVSVLVVSVSFINLNWKNNVWMTFCMLVAGYLIIKSTTNSIVDSIYNNMLSNMGHSEETLNIMQSQSEIIKINMNKIRSMAMIFIQNENYELEKSKITNKISQQQNQNKKANQSSLILKQKNNFNKWWTHFNKEIIIHRMNCQNTKCQCHKKQNPNQEIYLLQIINKLQKIISTYTKNIQLKIINIYQFIQLSKKPLKGYYELIKIKSSNKNDSYQIQINQLTLQTRQCFDQLFLKHQVKNQRLQLTKVIDYQELLIQSQAIFKQILTQTIRFYSTFNQNNLNINKIKAQSNQLTALKKQLQQKLSLILNCYSSNIKSNILVYFFYSFVQVYTNKESQLKKISQMQLLKKRFQDKKEINVFSPEYGTVLIDLVQERGKIKNLTKSISSLFGHSKQDMIGFNINQFMPRLFGYHHAKFLNNFIQKGRIKLLSYSSRDIFGKNKKKFIFPLKVSLKAQYLQDNFFGSSGLIRQIQTSSEYIMVDKYGKVEQITQNLYRKVFAVSFQDQHRKINRLHINKLLLSFNILSEDKQNDKSKYQKLVEGLLLYSQDGPYLSQKFKYLRDIYKQQKTTNSKSLNSIQNNGSYASQNNTTLYTSTASNSSNLATRSQSSMSMTLQKEQKRVNVIQMMKHFISELDFDMMSGYKITYKVLPIVTAQFEADLIQVTNINSFPSEQRFCQCLLQEVEQLVQAFELNVDEHPTVFNRIKQLKDQISQKSTSNLHFKTKNSSGNNIHSDSNNPYNYLSVDAPRGVIKKNKIETSFKSEDMNSYEEQNDIVEEREQLLQKASTHRSNVENIESQSKKQVLMQVFSNENIAYSSKYDYLAVIVIGVIVMVLIVLLLLGMMYMGLIEKQWISSSYIQKTRQIIEYGSSLQEIKVFQQINNVKISQFIADKQKQLTNGLKDNIKNIYESIVKENVFNQFYTDKFFINPSNVITYSTSHNMLQSSNTNNGDNNKLSTYMNINQERYKQEIQLVGLLRQLLWRFSYSSQVNKQVIKYNYQSYSMELRNIQNKIKDYLVNQQISTRHYILIANIIYLVLIVLVGIGLIPILAYFKNQQRTISQLLQYINFIELRKSINKFNLILQYINKIDSLHNLNHMKNQFQSKIVTMNKQKSQLLKDLNISNKNHVQKNIHTQLSNNGNNSILNSFNICGILIIIIILSGISVFKLSFFIYVSGQFNHSIQISRMVYQLQNKPAYLINTYLKGVNHLNKQAQDIQFSQQLITIINNKYFDTNSKLSSPLSNHIRVYQELSQLMSRSVCQLIDNCQNYIDKSDNKNNLDSAKKLYNSSTLQYLIYEYKNKFQLLSKLDNQQSTNNFSLSTNNINSDNYLSKKAAVQKWISQNKIQQLIQTIQIILTICNNINPMIYDTYYDYIKVKTKVTLIVCIFFILLNTVILFLIKGIGFRYFGESIKQTLSIFKHFDIQTLSQNTYLTSYFTNKLKQNK